MIAPVREGEVLAGKYRVDRVLGVGGMGVVVAAHHVQLDERVAIKFLAPEMVQNAEAMARFSREARAAVKIKSEHVARVSDVGTLENGAPYMVMEYLEGSDLSAWLAQQGALPVGQAVEFVLQACEAIAEAHALGIVHRDLKPSNLFVIRRPDGDLSVKVLDFGISKLTAVGSTPEASMTRTSALMGSPLYMSPEQVRSSRDVDARADIWSLGVILYELLAGACPFVAETMPQLLYLIMSESPAPLRTKRPEVPEELDAIILRCLDKDRGKRFESVGELAVALYPHGPRRSRRSVERISGVMKAAGFSATSMALPSSSETRSTTSTTAASFGRTKPPNQRATYLGWGAAALVLIGAVVASFAGSHRSAEPAAGASPTTAAQAVPSTVQAEAEARMPSSHSAAATPSGPPSNTSPVEPSPSGAARNEAESPATKTTPANSPRVPGPRAARSPSSPAGSAAAVVPSAEPRNPLDIRPQ